MDLFKLIEQFLKLNITGHIEAAAREQIDNKKKNKDDEASVYDWQGALEKEYQAFENESKKDMDKRIEQLTFDREELNA